MTLFKLTAPDENGLQPTKWAKESSPGQSRGLDPCDALGQQISNDSPHVGVGSPPTPTRGENLGKYGLSTQGMAGGGARRHLAPRLLPFVRSARGYFPLALPAIFMKVTQDLFRSPRPMKMLEGPAPSGPRLRQVTAVTRATLHQNRIFIKVSQLVRPVVALVLIFVASLVLAAQVRSGRPPSPKVRPSTVAGATQGQGFPVQFTDITRQAGIRFTHNNGAFGKKYLPETMGAGCAFLDYNNDGWPDILLINGMDWPGHRHKPSYPALYRNNKNGTLTDVTREAGLAVEMYGMGVAVGDYDNDGFEDIYISCLGPGHLFRNLGNGKFMDVTQRSKITNSDFASSCAWLDYDRDGRLDLFICNYVQWSMEKDIYCTLDGVSKSYCTPESYKGASPRLYRNLGDGTFEDVTQKAGLLDLTSKSLGVAVFDCNNDGWPDLLIANDTQPNKLYVNNKNGTFSERGVTSGIAYSEDGTVRGAMGVDFGDYDGSGFASLVIGNFSNEMLSLYHNEGNGLFLDEAPTSTVGQASLLTLAFGCFFFDMDLDGKSDIFVADGHVETDINRVQKRVTYAQPPHLFRNLGNKLFAEVTARVGASLRIPKVARGCAFADIDNDGDLDLLLTTNGGPAYLYRNDGGNANHYLRIKTVGTRSNRDGIGTLVRLKLADGTLWGQVKSGSSYCSQSELPLTFGLGKQSLVPILEVSWPSGTVDRFYNVAANQTLTVKEGTGSR